MKAEKTSRMKQQKRNNNSIILISAPLRSPLTPRRVMHPDMSIQKDIEVIKEAMTKVSVHSLQKDVIKLILILS
jgi:hypothetical protein